MSTAALSRRDELIDNLKSRLRGVRDRAKNDGMTVIRSAECIGVGYAMGMAEAKWGTDGAWGMAPSLAVGIAASGLALLDVGGADVTPHLRAVGDSSLAVYAYTKGFEHQTARQAA